MNDTLTAGDVDVQTLERAFEDDRVPCGYVIIGCQEEAAWRYQHMCGDVWLACGRHRMHEDSRMNGIIRPVCRACNGYVPTPVPWLPI